MPGLGSRAAAQCRALFDRRFWLIAIVLLSARTGAQVASTLEESQTFDEAAHLVAGYSYWKTGDFRLNREHPPLSKLAAALPLLAMDLKWPAEHPGWEGANPWELGREFLYRNRRRPDEILFAARLGTIAAGLVLGVLIAAWVRRRWGSAAALAALLLFALDPNFIAHGRYVTSDVWAALGFFAAIATWLDAVESPSVKRFAIASAALGLALSAKFSLAVLPLFLIVLTFRRALAWKAIVPVSLGALLVVAVLYGPETPRSFSRPKLRQQVDPTTLTGRVFSQAGKRLGLPGHFYLLGLYDQAVHSASGHASSYLMRQVSTSGFRWYFPVAFLVKTPTALLLLILTALVLRRGPPELWAAAAGFFALCLASSLNIGQRHLLPVYPFLFVIGGLVLARLRWPLVILAIALLAGETVAVHPYYTAFFNFPSGGPSHGREYLVDSNLDWGQDLKRLGAWHVRQGRPPLCLEYFGMANSAAYGLEANGIPSSTMIRQGMQVDCIGAISATLLEGAYVGREKFQWLRDRTPSGSIGHSIVLYDLRNAGSER